MENQMKTTLSAHKAEMNEALENAIMSALEHMGADIMGIDWFSSHAEHYNNMRDVKAA